MVEALVVSNIILWLVVIALGVICLALSRQIGVLYERVAPAGALMVNAKLKSGDKAPEMTATTISGDKISIGGLPETSKSQLLFFLAPDCPVCKSLLPVIKSLHRAEGSWLDVVFASDGEHAAHNVFVQDQGLNAFPYIVSELLGKAFGVAKLPYAVLIDEEGKIASLGIVNSREHLESLFESKERGVLSLQAYLAGQEHSHAPDQERANQ